MNNKRATGRWAGWGKRLALLAPATGLTAAAVTVAALPGQALGSTGGARLAAASASRGAVPAHCPTKNLRIDQSGRVHPAVGHDIARHVLNALLT